MIGSNTTRLQETLQEERMQLDAVNKMIENKNSSLIINTTIYDENSNTTVTIPIRDDTKEITSKTIYNYLSDIVYYHEQLLFILNNTDEFM